MSRPRSLMLVSVLLAGCSSFGAAAANDAGAAGPDAGSGTPSDAGGDAATSLPLTEYPAVVAADNPLAYWRFGEKSGTTAASVVGGKAMEATITSTGSDPVLGYAGALAKDADTAFLFRGQNGALVEHPGFDFSERQPFSLEAWFFPTDVDGTFRHLFVKDSSTNDATRNEYGVYFNAGTNADHGLTFERITLGQHASVTVPTDAVARGTWHHVVATYDGATLRLYFDGQAAGAAVDGLSQPSKPWPFRIGAKTPTSGPVFGAMDEVAVYDHALSAERVKAHLAAGRP